MFNEILSGLILLFLLFLFGGDLRNKKGLLDLPSSEIYFALCLFLISFMVKLHGWRSGVFMYFLFSLFFFVWYLFHSSILGILSILFFFFLAFGWHYRRISGKGMILALVFSMGWFHYILKDIWAGILLFPTFVLVGGRTSSEVRFRFSSKGVSDGDLLSHKQWDQEGGFEALFTSEFFFKTLSRIWNFFGGIEPSGPDSDTRLYHAPVLAGDRCPSKRQDYKLLKDTLSNLGKHDACFSEEFFLSRTKEVFWKVQNAIGSRNPDEIGHFLADGLREQLFLHFEELKAAGLLWKIDELDLNSWRTQQVQQTEQFDLIHVKADFMARDVVVDEKTGKPLQEESYSQTIEETWSFIRKPDVKTPKGPGLFEGSCPNCSAVLQVGKSIDCPSCRSFIRSGAYDWVLYKITPSCEWKVFEWSEIFGLADLKTKDPEFSPADIEDRTAVIFWRLREAERKGNPDPMRKYSLDSFLEILPARWKIGALEERQFHERSSLGMIQLIAIKPGPEWDRLFVRVSWSGLPVQVLKNGRTSRKDRHSRIFSDVLVLSRRKGVTSKANGRLSSAHCISCGAPQSSGTNSRCDYCDQVLNEGSGAWVLERLTTEADRELRELFLTKTAAGPPTWARPPEGGPQNIRSGLPHGRGQEIPRFARTTSKMDVLSIFVQVMLADGKIDDREMELLTSFSKFNGIPREKVLGLIESFKEGLVYVPQGLTRSQSLEILQAGIEMAYADGELSPEEITVIQDLAKSLNFSKTDVNIQLAKKKKDLAMLEKNAQKSHQKTD